ncbi:MAG: acyltransferase family protein [bacterium]
MSASHHEHRMQFRPDIEGLRAVAIVSVVLYHAGLHVAAGGYRGVDVFFVLSGFLITGILLDEVRATGTVSLMNFWARRARRLLPAAFVITAAILIASALVLSPFEQIQHAEGARAFAVYASNILFAVRSTFYAGAVAARDSLLHTWSLSVEEQFYLLFAPSLLLLATWSRSRGEELFRRRFLTITVTVIVVSLIGCLLMVWRYPLVGFFILPTRAWEFGLGALTALGVRGPRRLGPTANEAVSWIGLFAVLASTVVAKHNSVQLLGPVTILPTIGTAVLIMAGASAVPSKAARLLSVAPMRLVGRLSYSWYLWHWPALVFFHEFKSQASTRMNVAVALGSLIPAAATYTWIESPIRFSKWLQRRPRLAVGGAIALSAVTVLMATAAIGYAEHILAGPGYAPIAAGRALPAVYANGCHLTIAARRIPECVFGSATSDTTVVLFGDSHAAQWFPAIEQVAKSRGWKLVSMTKSACPSVAVRLYNGQLGRRYTECEEWRDSAVQRIASLRPTIIVVANSRSYEVYTGDELLRVDQRAEARAEWGAGLRRTLAALAPSGATVLVMQNNPHPGVDPSRCLVRNLANPDRCDAKVRAMDTVMVPVERAAIRENANASYVSLNEFICPSGRCQAMVDGIVRYEDSNHLSVLLAASLAPQMSLALSRVLADHGPQSHSAMIPQGNVRGH